MKGRAEGRGVAGTVEDRAGKKAWWWVGDKVEDLGESLRSVKMMAVVVGSWCCDVGRDGGNQKGREGRRERGTLDATTKKGGPLRERTKGLAALPPTG